MVELAGKQVGPIGYGLMGLTWRKPAPSQEQAFAAMKAAIAAGATFWNGGEFYGPPERNSLHLLNEYFTQYPEDADKVVLSIKGGIDLSNWQPDGSAEGIRRSVEQCLKLLGGKKKLDLFECARVDPKTPIEVTMRALNEYIKAGKLGGVTLSECSAATVRRAAKITKIHGVEVEYSLFATEILENGVAEACAELDIPVVAYSPLGRGFLTGAVKTPEDLPEQIRSFPRFEGENFHKNMELTHEVEKLAKAKGCPVSQVATAWTMAHNGEKGHPLVIPIPGATTEARVQENSKQVKLTAEELKELEDILKKCIVVGERYPNPKHLYGDSPEEDTGKLA